MSVYARRDLIDFIVRPFGRRFWGAEPSFSGPKDFVPVHIVYVDFQNLIVPIDFHSTVVPANEEHFSVVMVLEVDVVVAMRFVGVQERFAQSSIKWFLAMVCQTTAGNFQKRVLFFPTLAVSERRRGIRDFGVVNVSGQNDQSGHGLPSLTPSQQNLQQTFSFSGEMSPALHGGIGRQHLDGADHDVDLRITVFQLLLEPRPLLFTKQGGFHTILQKVRQKRVLGR